MRFALRNLAKSPGFTAVALLTLALGIGVNTTTFTLVNALLYRLPAFREPDRLVMVFGTLPQGAYGTQSPANVRDELAQATVFEQASVWCVASFNLAQPGEPANRVTGLSVSGNYFSTLGVAPLVGRTFNPSDEGPGHYNVVVVSERFWRSDLGADPAVVGRTLRLDGTPVTVVGVMPGNCNDTLTMGPVDIWQPVGYAEEGWQIRDNDWLNVIARLRPGVGIGEARAQMNTIGARLAHDHPEVNSHRGLNMALYAAARVQGSRTITWVIMGLMLFVLMIACVNLANLQIARASGRTREFAVRIALGASRGRVIAQLLEESVLLSLDGGCLGLLVAVWGNRLLGSRLRIFSDSPGFPLPLDGRVLAFTLAVSVATGIAFGLAPAVIASRTNVGETLKQGGRGSTADRSKHRLRQALVAGELALALALLAGAGFFLRGMVRLAHYDPGWTPGRLVTGSIVLPWGTYRNNDQVRAAVDRLKTALGEIPGVKHAKVSGSIPVYYFSHRSNFVVEGRPEQQGLEPIAVYERVTPGYFSTIGMRLISGRDFTEADRADSKAVVVINRSMADRFWPNGDAVGHRIGDPDPKGPVWREIIGVVNDVRLAGNPGPSMTQFQAYRPFNQDPEHWLAFTLQLDGAPSPVIEGARHAVARVDADLAVYNLGTVDSLIDESAANMRLIVQVLSIAATLGLLLSLVGIYGVVAHMAAQRTQEIGIRMALGASGGMVLWLILRNGARLALLGTGIGLLAAFAVGRALSLAIPSIPGQDPVVVVTLAVLMAAATLLACWIPALRATRVNPVEALRTE